VTCPDCPPAPRWRRRAVAAVVAVGLGLGLAGELWGRPAAAPRRGRVERVERPRFAVATALRVCSLIPGNEDRVTCYGGTAPQPGTRYHLIDEYGVRAVAESTRSETSAADSCRLGTMNDVFLTIEGGPLAARRQGYSATVGVQGIDLDRRARRVEDPALRSPSGREGDLIWIAIDRDGDEIVDLAVTYADCTGQVSGTPNPPSSSQKVTPYCMDYWLKERLDWRRVNREVYLSCF
jgi:hypothetical protein